MRIYVLMTSVVSVIGLVVMSCSWPNPMPSNPTPTAAPVPAIPTPLVAGDLREVELDTNILYVLDMFGTEALGFDTDWELWLVDIGTGEAQQLTNDGHPKYGGALSADYVAWIDQRRMIQLSGYSSYTPEFSSDVFVRNRHTGEERRITDEPASRQGLRMSGTRLVWHDNRNGLLEDRPRDYDIYLYDLENSVEIPVAVAPGTQLMPDIHGDTVVWSDNRNSADRGTPKAGCGNCSDNRFDIYSHNLASAKEKPLVETGDHNGPPSIHGERVTWQQFGAPGESAIVLLDLGTGEQTILGTGGRGEARPLISEDHAIWTVKETCDVDLVERNPRSKPQPGVYAYGLKTGEVHQLSSYVEPNALLHGNLALITETCFTINRQYAVFLD